MPIGLSTRRGPRRQPRGRERRRMRPLPRLRRAALRLGRDPRLRPARGPGVDRCENCGLAVARDAIPSPEAAVDALLVRRERTRRAGRGPRSQRGQPSGLARRGELGRAPARARRERQADASARRPAARPPGARGAARPPPGPAPGWPRCGRRSSTCSPSIATSPPRQLSGGSARALAADRGAFCDRRRDHRPGGDPNGDHRCLPGVRRGARPPRRRDRGAGGAASAYG